MVINNYQQLLSMTGVLVINVEASVLVCCRPCLESTWHYWPLLTSTNTAYNVTCIRSAPALYGMTRSTRDGQQLMYCTLFKDKDKSTLAMWSWIITTFMTLWCCEYYTYSCYEFSFWPFAWRHNTLSSSYKPIHDCMFDSSGWPTCSPILCNWNHGSE
jgi:hypothetical protein